MKQNQNLNELNQEYSKFENETKKFDLLNDKYKDNISKEIKKLDKNNISNSIYVESKFTLWQRIMRALGMN
jgi:acetyl-CoA carboxylase alpha subunit